MDGIHLQLAGRVDPAPEAPEPVPGAPRTIPHVSASQIVT